MKEIEDIEKLINFLSDNYKFKENFINYTRFIGGYDVNFYNDFFSECLKTVQPIREKHIEMLKKEKKKLLLEMAEGL